MQVRKRKRPQACMAPEAEVPEAIEVIEVVAETAPAPAEPVTTEKIKGNWRLIPGEGLRFFDVDGNRIPPRRKKVRRADGTTWWMSVYDNVEIPTMETDAIKNWKLPEQIHRPPTYRK